MDTNIYVLLHKSGEYFEKQNIYLGFAALTEKIYDAKKMALNEAETYLRCMNEKEDWQIINTTMDLQNEVQKVENITNILLPALRQYQHNDCSGFVAGYDIKETDKIVSELQSLLEEIRILILRGKLTLSDEIHKRITLACK